MEDLLFSLKGATAKALTRRSMIKSLEPVRVFAEFKAPERIGVLRSNIKISSKAKPRARKRSDVEVYVGPDRSVRQAIPQEFGTIKHSPSPYMRPAWDAKKFEVLVTFEGEMWDQLYTAIERQERKIARDAEKLKRAR